MGIKALIEKKNSLVEQLETLLGKAETETRALTEEELAEFERVKAEIENLTKTIAALQEKIDGETKSDSESGNGETQEMTTEERSFISAVRGIKAETRADSNFTKNDNTTMIPTTIIDKIIAKVKEISPLYGMATKYTNNGNITIPYVDDSAGDVKMAWADEFTELEATSMKFKSISLSGYLAGVLCKVSKSLLNNSDFDLLSYIINYMAEAIAVWIDKTLIDDSAGKIEGMSGVTQTVTTAGTMSITADDLIELQESVPDVYQNNAIWVMNKSTRKFIRKLKDNDGQYLLNKDVSEKWNYTLLGKPVYISDAMPEVGDGKPVIYYGDMSGLAVKVNETASLEVLREKYATQHCIGINAWMEWDSKIENAQKIAALEVKTT